MEAALSNAGRWRHSVDRRRHWRRLDHVEPRFVRFRVRNRSSGRRYAARPSLGPIEIVSGNQMKVKEKKMNKLRSDWLFFINYYYHHHDHHYRLLVCACGF